MQTYPICLSLSVGFSQLGPHDMSRPKPWLINTLQFSFPAIATLKDEDKVATIQDDQASISLSPQEIIWGGAAIPTLIQMRLGA